MFQQPLAILGGTFDPVHNGHLAIANLLYRDLDLQEIRFIPCKQPVLKNHSYATAADLLAMLKLAIAPYPAFSVDTRELERETPSYTIDTLYSLRNDYPLTPLCLILGMDVFLDLPRWQRWQELLSLCHIILINRQHSLLTQPSLLNTFLLQHETENADLLSTHLAGYIFQTKSVAIAISSSIIRHKIQAAKFEEIKQFLPLDVWQYIEKNRLYTRA